MRRPSPQAMVSAAVVAVAALFVLLQLQPSLILAKTTASGGDMGAQVWGPAYLRDHVLNHGRLSGWSPDWYAGFPAYHFYFPLPALLVILLDVLLPYAVAFKLVTVLGLCTLPFSAWTFGRMSRMPFPTPALLGLATVPFLFDRFHTIWGGNAAATLAGEFAFSISLSFGLLFLAVVAGGLETGRHRGLAAALLAATALSHLIPAAFVVVGAVVLVLVRRPTPRGLVFGATIGGTGAAVASFWLVPFLLRLPYSNDMGWEPTRTYKENLLPFLRTDVAANLTSHMKLVVAMAALGAVLALVRRRPGAIAVVIMALLTAAAFRFVPNGPIWNARVLPFWYLSLYLLAAVAVGELFVLVAAGLRSEDGWDGDQLLRIAPVVGLVAVILAVGGPLGVVPSWTGFRGTDTSFIPGWAKWNYSGYERKASYPEYHTVMETMARVGREEGCGRAMWEYESQLDRFGTPMAFMLLPHWTKGCIGSMEGLFFESSATVPYHFLNQSELSNAPSRAMRDLPYRALDVAAGVRHMQLLGVRYYMATTPEAQTQADANPDLEVVATTPPVQYNYPTGLKARSWQIYKVAGSELVAPLRYQPAVMTGGAEGKTGWLDAAVDYYQDEARWEVPLAAGGPADWPRIPGPTASAPRQPVAGAVVSSIRTGDDRISFDVDRPGTPVLVKASYFPNWKASGAKGPYRVTPNLMVVVPTGTHVELHYGWTGVDLLGIVLALAGLAGVVLLTRAAPVAFPAPGGEPPVVPGEPARAPAPGQLVGAGVGGAAPKGKRGEVRH